MKALNNIFRRATENPKRVVLAEGEDLRIITAAVTATERGIAEITLLGDVDKINTEAAAAGLDLKSISVIDPAESKAIEHYADAFYQLRQHKGMTMGKAVELMQDPLHFAQMMVHLNDADGSVCGAVYTTGDTVRAAIQIIGMAENASMISSFFLMMLCEPFHQLKGGVIFSDCGLVIDPNKEQLAQIAMSASNSARTLLEEEPKVAMLSFSTSGSANHAAVDKVVEATAIVKQHMPDLAIDGDVQLDAAIVSEIAERKVSDSETQGKANVLVFPNLEAGNIGYKLAERIGRADAIGPILQGLKKPANDLSRGCSANDVVNVIAITVVQSQTL
ncbi:phosphate acetyltransferase [Amphritea balenae]|uniref:Phosphate acetyltransferase n=1 Tax=Amphritea balenae TaxID=452629 RepID=A0A3P1SQN4_9GAMM|nr:phosphate acetyltransferase [Amphritea balenae]RRC99369.1 phosphate acetyltransferase [Amphritea balenae]GGK71700.1 phosphate acetyltransferase [Amphritea balenae]